MSHNLFLSPSNRENLLVQSTEGESESIGFVASADLSAEGNEHHLHWDWALYDAVGGRNGCGEHATLPQIQQVLAQNNIEEVGIIGLVPASYVFHANINIPSRQHRVIQQALPFAVEELVAQDIDALHLAIGDRNKKNDIPVLVIDRSIFEAYYHVWNQSGLPLFATYADAQLLPLESNDLVVLLDAEKSWLKANNAALQMNSKGLAHYIESWMEEHKAEGETAALKVYQCHHEPNESHLVIAEVQQIANLTVDVEQCSLKPNEFFAVSYFHNTDAIDMCQGDYTQEEKSGSQWRKWLGVAAVLTVWFLAEVGLNIGKGAYYSHQADKSLQVALQEYKAVFPNDRRVSESNLKKFLESKLRAASQQSQGADFLTVLGVTGAQYYKVSAAGTMTFNSINFNAQRGELNIELQAKSLDQLDQLKKGISTAGLDSKISSAVKEKDYIRGRISISGS
jgi:general secretion pathway protein L